MENEELECEQVRFESLVRTQKRNLESQQHVDDIEEKSYFEKWKVEDFGK